jgi:hypothetical protein
VAFPSTSSCLRRHQFRRAALAPLPGGSGFLVAMPLARPCRASPPSRVREPGEHDPTAQHPSRSRQFMFFVPFLLGAARSSFCRPTRWCSAAAGFLLHRVVANRCLTVERPRTSARLVAACRSRLLGPSIGFPMPRSRLLSAGPTPPSRFWAVGTGTRMLHFVRTRRASGSAPATGRFRPTFSRPGQHIHHGGSGPAALPQFATDH